MIERRYFLFLILSTAIILVTPTVVRWIWPVPPQPARKQVARDKQEEQRQERRTDLAEEKPAAGSNTAEPPAVAAGDAGKPDVGAKQRDGDGQNENEAVERVAVQPPVTVGSDRPDSDYLIQVRFRNVGACIEEVVLNRFKNEQQTGPLTLLAMTEPSGPWRTVNGIPFGTAALDVPSEHADLARRPWHVEGPTPVTGKDGSEAGVRVRFWRSLPRSGIKVTKTYTVWKGKYAIDVEIALENPGQQEQSLAYWLYGPRGTVLEGWWYAWTKREVALALVRDGAAKRGTHYAASLAKSCRRLAERLGELDGNRDGTIERSEWTEATVEPWPDEFDLNGDNKLSPSEALLYVHVTAGRDDRWDLLDRVDFAGTENQYFCALLLPGKQAASAIAEVWPVLNTIYVDHPDLSDPGVLIRSKPVELKPGARVSHRYRLYVGPRDEATFVAAVGRSDLAGYVTNYGMFSGIARLMLSILKLFHRIVPNWGVAIILLTVVVRLAMHPLTRRQIIMSQRMQKKMAALKPELDKLKEKYKGDREALGRATLELYRKHGVNPLAPLQGCLPLLVQMPIFVGLWRALSSAVELRQAPFVLWIDNLAAPDMLFPFGVSLPILGPYFNLLPVLSLVLMYYQQKWLTPPSPDPEIQAQQRMTMVMMTIFTLLIFYKLPSGLCLYFLASTAWGLAERKLIPKIEHIDESAAEQKQAVGSEPAKRRRRRGRARGRAAEPAETTGLMDKLKQSSLGRKLIEILEQAEKK